MSPTVPTNRTEQESIPKDFPHEHKSIETLITKDGIANRSIEPQNTPLLDAKRNWTIEKLFSVQPDDVEAIKKLFGEAFPIQYGDFFYDSLKKGSYANRPLMTALAKSSEGRVIGAACASREEDSQDAPKRMIESGSKTYLMTLAVLPE